MANNRMYLVNRRTGGVLTIAKFYPDTGWYSYPQIEGNLDEFFKSNKADPTMFGDEDYEIQYETNDDPKRQIMRAVIASIKTKVGP